ncbi:MAG: hypothetical protein QM763_18280 [Agriterribacter sp.]
MKTFFTTLIFAFTTMLTFAQTTEHLSFKGVPIDGTLNVYISKMKQNGFTHIKTEDGVAMLKGDFASYKGCIVGVATVKGKDLVSKITVIFSKQDSWSMLSSNYFNLKEMLTEKYGEPSESIEDFSSYEPEDDGSKMTQVHLDACKYISTYKTDKGDIQLSIKGDISSAFVVLAYYDKINSEIIRKKAKDDL